jgi:acetyltransferase-like isoleucine patch superfamily enzyme
MNSKAGGLLLGDFRLSLWRTALAASQGRKVLIGAGFRVIGVNRIDVHGGQLRLGISRFGFAGKDLPGLLRVEGHLSVLGTVKVGSGNRWDVGRAAEVRIGAGTYLGPSTRLIITEGLQIGSNCAISWDCQFLDDDFHTIRAGRQSAAPITIGDRVWIGTRASVLRGSVIGDGCVVAAGSIVRGDFSEPRTLIAGTPARVIRRAVDWQ